MNTHHSYSLQFLQIDTLVVFPPLHNFNVGLISCPAGKEWGHEGVTMQQAAGWLARWILWQQWAQLKVCGAGNKGFAHQWGVETGCLSSLGYREGGWEACCILTPLGLRCSTSDTPGITRLLQLVGGFASETLTSHPSTEGATVWRSNPTPGTAGVSSFWLCTHARARVLHIHKPTAILERTLTTHTPSAPWGLQW